MERKLLRIALRDGKTNNQIRKSHNTTGVKTLLDGDHVDKGEAWENCNKTDIIKKEEWD